MAAERTGILLVLDRDGPSSDLIERGVRVWKADGGGTVRVLYLLPSLPPELLEFGGAENPAVERAMDAELKDRQDAWAAERDARARAALERAAADLRRAGIPPDAIELEHSEATLSPHSAEALADDILRLATADGRRTVVVRRGRETSTGEDVAAALAARERDITVSLVG